MRTASNLKESRMMTVIEIKPHPNGWKVFEALLHDVCWRRVIEGDLERVYRHGRRRDRDVNEKARQATLPAQGTKLFQVLSQITEQTPSAFRATRCYVETIGDWRKQQLAIDIRNPLVDRLPALLHCPSRN
jgi:hypothetical protein